MNTLVYCHVRCSNTQGHMCYNKPVQLCEVSVVVWHTRTRHEIIYGLNFKTSPQTGKSENRRKFEPHLEEL
jgi:hypothetical protein